MPQLVGDRRASSRAGRARAAGRRRRMSTPPLSMIAERYVQQSHVDANGLVGFTGAMTTTTSAAATAAARTGVGMAVGLDALRAARARRLGRPDRPARRRGRGLAAAGRGPGVLLLVLVRPRPLATSPARALLACVALGVVTAGVTMLFMAAVARLPLGTASALEFLGPLGRRGGPRPRRRHRLWPALAAVGVLLLTEPWQRRRRPGRRGLRAGGGGLLGGLHPADPARRRRGRRAAGPGGVDAGGRAGRHARGRARRSSAG